MNPQIPNQIKKFAYDPKVYDTLESIGNGLDLNIDQIGELDAEVQRILLGTSSSSNFVKNISAALEIEDTRSRVIADEVNKKVFSVIKNDLQVSTNKQHIASIEKAGNFTIEHDIPRPGSMANNRPPLVSVMSIKPAPIEKPANMPTNLLGKTEVSHFNSEPLVDQLMRGTKPSIFEPTPATPPVTPKPVTPPVINTPSVPPSVAPEHTVAEPPVNLPTSDTYREVIK